jgi:hypothetical protein
MQEVGEKIIVGGEGYPAIVPPFPGPHRLPQQGRAEIGIFREPQVPRLMHELEAYPWPGMRETGIPVMDTDDLVDRSRQYQNHVFGKQRHFDMIEQVSGYRVVHDVKFVYHLLFAVDRLVIISIILKTWGDRQNVDQFLMTGRMGIYGNIDYTRLALIKYSFVVIEMMAC